MSDKAPEVVVPVEVVAAKGPSNRMRIFSGVTSILSFFTLIGWATFIGGMWMCSGVTRFMSSSEDDDRDLCNPDGLTDTEKQSSAYHEAGHTVVTLATHPEWFETTDVFPYGVHLGEVCATGLTSLKLPADMSRDEIRDEIAIEYGGYIADLSLHGRPMTGSSRDILMATDLALSAVREWGMGENTPPYNFRLLRAEGVVFDGHTTLTESMEVRMLLDEAITVAIQALNENDDKVIIISEALADAPSLRLNAVDISEVLAQQTTVDPVSISAPE